MMFQMSKSLVSECASLLGGERWTRECLLVRFKICCSM